MYLHTPTSARYIYTLSLPPNLPTHSHFHQIYLHTPTSARYTYTLPLQSDIPTHYHFSQIYLHTPTSVRYTYTLPLQPDIPMHSHFSQIYLHAPIIICVLFISTFHNRPILNCCSLYFSIFCCRVLFYTPLHLDQTLSIVLPRATGNAMANIWYFTVSLFITTETELLASISF